jgi:hypothetical protein
VEQLGGSAAVWSGGGGGRGMINNISLLTTQVLTTQVACQGKTRGPKDVLPGLPWRLCRDWIEFTA